MSEMKGQPVLMCKRCGKPYTFFLTTAKSDTEGKLLHQFMAGVLEEHYCPECTAQHTAYIQQGRDADWLAGRP